MCRWKGACACGWVGSGQKEAVGVAGLRIARDALFFRGGGKLNFFPFHRKPLQKPLHLTMTTTTGRDAASPFTTPRRADASLLNNQMPNRRTLSPRRRGKKSCPLLKIEFVVRRHAHLNRDPMPSTSGSVSNLRGRTPATVSR